MYRQKIKIKIKMQVSDLFQYYDYFLYSVFEFQFSHNMYRKMISMFVHDKKCDDSVTLAIKNSTRRNYTGFNCRLAPAILSFAPRVRVGCGRASFLLMFADDP